ncbi:MAG: hypothetical protein IJ489_10680 [Clostridia bacterium]|nr:hypothetical protein [Clostridia bacterium]
MQRNMKFLSFWSINDGVQTEALCRQMEDLKRHGMDGVVFHPRFYPGGPNYMTADFIQTVGEVILFAKSLGMEFWLYDENGWPSGSADGQVLKVHPNSKRWGLVFLNERELRDDDRVLCHHHGKIVAARGVLGISPLCRATTDTFLALTHERYFRELPREAFDYVTGFFCDEVDYFPFHLLSEGAVPWCDEFEAFYIEKYGVSPCAELWKLFDTETDHPEFKIRFWETAGDLIARNFYQPYQEWCERYGKLFTGHLKGEESPYFQLMFSGSCFTQLKNLSLPAIDTLERYHGNHFFPYLLTSIAAQQGRLGCLAEAMGGAGWGIRPEDLEEYMLWLAEAGVERIALHLGQFVLKAQAIRDWPPSVPLHLTWHDAFADVLKRIRYLSKPLLEKAWNTSKILIVTPTRGIMAKYQAHHAEQINLHDGSGIPDSEAARINMAFLEMVENCYTDGWQYHFTEERELKTACLKDGKLYLGAMTYEKILIADGCLFENDEQALIDQMRVLDMLCEAPEKQLRQAKMPNQTASFIPEQTAWQIAFPKENQILIEWKNLSNGHLQTIIPTKNIHSAVLILSDPIQNLKTNTNIQAIGDFKKRFELSEIADVLTLEIELSPVQPLPFAWLCGDFSVSASAGWKEFDSNQVTCDGKFELNGSAQAKNLYKGELVSQGLPFFSGLLKAEKRFTLTEKYLGCLTFDHLSVTAAKIYIDGKEIGWWWKNHPLPIEIPAGKHILSMDAAPSTYNMYGPHHYYLGDCRLTSPDTFFGRGGYTDNPDAPSNTFIDTMQFVKFTIDGDLVFLK